MRRCRVRTISRWRSFDPFGRGYAKYSFQNLCKEDKELYLKDGRPEGTYVIYYPDGKIAEVRSYYHGIFHGEWRTYSDNGQLIGLASYKEGQKDGPWRIWSDKGNLFYTAGKKSGVWRSWDEEGNLLSEENQ